jgi:hypothetical protein
MPQTAAFSRARRPLKKAARGVTVASHSSLEVLKVFLASRGDLAEERRTAKQVVDDLNSFFCRQLGWHVDLCGWEDTLPGAGRPQKLINRMAPPVNSDYR